MALRFDITRPDDLLNLQIEGVNLRLDTTDATRPALVVADVQHAAYLVVTFPPQAVAETAYFESSSLKPDAPSPSEPANSPGAKTSDDPLNLPGVAGAHPSVAQLAHRSRLVFDISPVTRIPYSMAGLLDWSQLRLNVSPIAAIGPNPPAEQITGAPAIAPPGPNETALELPYRLWISPNRDVAWSHRLTPFTARGRTELWHTRLMARQGQLAGDPTVGGRVALRAIWSPDYDQAAPPAPAKSDADLGRTAMSANDRHQLVVLTSAFHGYEVDVEISALIGGIPLRFTRPHVPAPFEAEQLILSPLGGWLRSRGHWDPPRRELDSDAWPLADLENILRLLNPSFDIRGPIAGDQIQEAEDRHDQRLVIDRRRSPRRPTFPGVFKQPEPEQLDLSEWVHVATQGRDHYVRIVYEGELLPFGHRAALVKVTERKFKQNQAIVGAYLMQRMFIVVREPERSFAAGDRSMPLKRVRLTTTVTPDIADPAYILGSKRSFWVEVASNPPAREPFRFHAVGTDISGRSVDFTIPLVFMSISLDLALSAAPRAGRGAETSA
ncbi:MAG: hypothetical protein M3401_06115 [Actinomycetota bacterium]|nr:hypothetical protein [Actinomycetota bacterium]